MRASDRCHRACRLGAPGRCPTADTADGYSTSVWAVTRRLVGDGIFLDQIPARGGRDVLLSLRAAGSPADADYLDPNPGLRRADVWLLCRRVRGGRAGARVE